MFPGALDSVGLMTCVGHSTLRIGDSAIPHHSYTMGGLALSHSASIY